MAALFPPTEEALWGEAAAAPGGHGGDSLARTRQTTSHSGTKGKGQRRGGGGGGGGRIRGRKASADVLAVGPDSRRIALRRERGSEDLTRRGSGLGLGLGLRYGAEASDT